MPRETDRRITIRSPIAFLIPVMALGLAAFASPADAAQLDIPGPPGSIAFGTSVTVLPNGNIVVTDPGALSNAGAVHLYSPTGILISTLTGSTANDRVGGGLSSGSNIIVLANGHFVIRSPRWHNGAAADAGAATWANGVSGVSGVVSPANSLVGTAPGDFVGLGGVTALTNGHYVVSNNAWDNGNITDAGAVTWANGSTGLVGVVSPTNSLVGTTFNDQVGNNAAIALPNGNYVVGSYLWSNGIDSAVGAVTWADGAIGLSGAVSAANSLVGATADDIVGKSNNSGPWLTVLVNGNYVVQSPSWNNGGIVDAGAVTWANGSTGRTGVVSSANSLVGSTASDRVGDAGIVALDNGHYVVRSTEWDSTGILNVGAVTWGNGNAGIAGAISSANSLIGASPDDRVGSTGIVPLVNGPYVVTSPVWDNVGTVNAGAVTWARGDVGLSGFVSTGNSLVGPSTGDQVGTVRALSNGHYIVLSPNWDFNATAPDVGAVTWRNGSLATSGIVSPSNSLIGSSNADRTGGVGTAALTNGNYVVGTQSWDDGFALNAGAVTWANGSSGLTGQVSSANSLIGATSSQQVGSGGSTALANGHYVVRTANWDNGAATDIGAVTWANGTTGLVGTVTSANSLIGTTIGEDVGSGGVTALPDGNYVVVTPKWDNGSATDAGAVTLADGQAGLRGTIGAANSVRGTVAGGGTGLRFGYDATRKQLVVGRPASNIVSLLTLPPDLAISKSDGVTAVNAGSTVTYTIVVTNGNAGVAATATVTDVFAAPLTACSWTCSGTGGNSCFPGGTGNINDGITLAAGGSVTYTATCTVSSAASGTVSNTAILTAPDDPNSANNASTDNDTVVTPQANLSITKTDGVTNVVPGSVVSYTLVAANSGPSAASASVTDTFPTVLSNCTWSCSGQGGATCASGGSGNISASPLSLPSGGAATYTASCTLGAAASGTLSNTATIAAASTFDPNPANNSATDTDTITALGDELFADGFE